MRSEHRVERPVIAFRDDVAGVCARSYGFSLLQARWLSLGIPGEDIIYRLMHQFVSSEQATERRAIARLADEASAPT